MKVKLLQNIFNLNGNGKTLNAGDVVELEDSVAQKQILRGLMVEVTDAPPAPPAPPASPEKVKAKAKPKAAPKKPRKVAKKKTKKAKKKKK